MTAVCPAGHTSTADDYCDVCGMPIDASAGHPGGAPGPGRHPGPGGRRVRPARTARRRTRPMPCSARTAATTSPPAPCRGRSTPPESAGPVPLTAAETLIRRRRRRRHRTPPTIAPPPAPTGPGSDERCRSTGWPRSGSTRPGTRPRRARTRCPRPVCRRSSRCATRRCWSAGSRRAATSTPTSTAKPTPASAAGRPADHRRHPLVGRGPRLGQRHLRRPRPPARCPRTRSPSAASANWPPTTGSTSAPGPGSSSAGPPTTRSRRCRPIRAPRRLGSARTAGRFLAVRV